VTREVAEGVAERLVGMPVAVPERVEQLRAELQRQGVLGIPHIETIAECLQVRMRGFDVNPASPNAVLLLLDEARSAAETICATLSRCLYGSEDRVVEIDCSRLSEASSVTLLLGSPPSYVGYKEHVPLHSLLQTPWSVVKLVDVHNAHPSILGILNAALHDGFFTDGSGRRIHVSDSVVVLTCRSPSAPAQQDGARDVANRVLGSEFVSVCDVVVAELPEGGEPYRRWFERDLMTSLAARFERRGLSVRWRPSVLDWLKSLKENSGSPLELRREMDRSLAHVLVPYLPTDSGVDAVAVGWAGGQLVAEPVELPVKKAETPPAAEGPADE
jgi:ATP-dependent Clp protease ATP-binding subunit ClpC